MHCLVWIVELNDSQDQRIVKGQTIYCVALINCLLIAKNVKHVLQLLVAVNFHFLLFAYISKYIKYVSKANKNE